MSTDPRVTPKVLLVDGDEDFGLAAVDGLGRLGFAVTWKPSAEAAASVLDEVEWDVILTDLVLPGTSGLALCARVVARHPLLPVVIITDCGSLETAVGAIRSRAYDFLTKPLALDSLAVTLEGAVEHHRLGAEVMRGREEVVQTVDGMIGTSAAMRRTFEFIERVANTDAAVLITGATGTGKELVARALHQRSHRKDGPFVAVNCAALPEGLLESELFGHVRGAFTDARVGRRGLFLKANGGTIFLDEIAEMPPAMQSKLLRVLQEHTVRPVGGDRDEPYDARIITATNRDIEAAVEQHRFREDLFYRINVMRTDLPPLAMRDHDVLLLAQHFVARANARLPRPHVVGLSSAAAAKLLVYSWPGNIRELENCIDRAVILARRDEVSVEDLSERVQGDENGTLSVLKDALATERLSMQEVERRHILRVLQSVGGSMAAAAEVLGVHQSTLYRKMAQYQGRPGRAHHGTGSRQRPSRRASAGNGREAHFGAPAPMPGH